MHFVLSNQIFRFDNCSKLTAKFKSYSFEPMGKSLGFEEDVVERGDQRDDRGGENMSWASVIFVLTWKANKKDNVYATRRSRNPRIKFQVNSNFVFRR